MSCNYLNREKVKSAHNKVLFLSFFKAVYFSKNNSNLMSISVSWNRKSSIIQKKENCQFIEGFRLKLTTSAVKISDQVF